MTKKASSQDKLVIGAITNIGEDGVLVRWGTDKTEMLHKHEELVPTQRPTEKEAECLPQPVLKWASCSAKENTEMWDYLAQSVLYQAYVSQSSAHGAVHVALASSQEKKADVVSLFAARDLKPKTLLLLPFNMPLVSGEESRPSGAVKGVVTVTPNKEEATHTMFWIKPKCCPRKHIPRHMEKTQ